MLDMTSDWKSYLKADPINWLLEDDNPSVKYFTLKDLLDRPETDAEVKKSKRQIMQSGPVPIIMSKQNPEGYWLTPENFYVKVKYKGTVWQILILAELGADGRHTGIRKAAEYILRNSQADDCGGFAYQSGASGGDRDKVLPCLTANMVWSLIRFGYLDDERVWQGIDWITRYQRFDDAIETAPAGWPYDRLEKCWGRHTCHMGVVKALKALSAVPSERRTAAINKTIGTGVEYLMKHHIYRKSHNLSQIAKPDWFKFGFPLMWKTDILEIAGILIRLGYKNEIIKDAVDIIIGKQNDEGKWLLEDTYNGRFLANIERKDKPSKWITLGALKVIKGFFG
jgi:hypothetical protein